MVAAGYEPRHEEQRRGGAAGPRRVVEPHPQNQDPAGAGGARRHRRRSVQSAHGNTDQVLQTGTTSSADSAHDLSASTTRVVEAWPHAAVFWCHGGRLTGQTLLSQTHGWKLCSREQLILSAVCPHLLLGKSISVFFTAVLPPAICKLLFPGTKVR